MCSTTPKTKAASPGLSNHQLFKTARITQNNYVTKFLTDAIQRRKTSLNLPGDKIETCISKNLEAAISIRAINNIMKIYMVRSMVTLIISLPSLIKVAAMYAAYRLLK